MAEFKSTAGMNVQARALNPELLFIWWHVDSAEVEGNGRYTLRLRDVEKDTVREVTDIDIGSDENRYYEHVKPGSRYRVELARVDPGEGQTVARSAEVRMPRAAPPERPEKAETEWVDLGGEDSTGESSEQPGDDPADEATARGLKWEEGLLDGASSSSL
ncbi:MAG: DUF4912 domain-containing protein [Candidatus Brocadiia bacterium]